MKSFIHFIKQLNKLFDLIAMGKENISVHNQIRNTFHLFFNGDEYIGIEPQGDIFLWKLNITDLQFSNTKKRLIIYVITERPGLLIGKGGVQLEKLRDNLSKVFKKPVTINIKESTVWNRLHYPNMYDLKKLLGINTY